MLEPIVTKRDEIREIMKFVMDDQALEKLEVHITFQHLERI